MESRRITVVDTRTSSTKFFDSEAETLGQLKEDMRKNGINPDGMAIQEGLSKTELVEDSSYLPHDVPYKGGTTNNLVFRLTQREKRIKSGAMSRGEAFTKIKEMGLTDTVKAKYGKNFTQCSTADLIAVIEEAEKKDNAQSDNTCCNCTALLANVVEAVKSLTSKLVENGVLDDDEKEEVDGLLVSEEFVVKDADGAPYSADEIIEMFNNMPK